MVVVLSVAAWYYFSRPETPPFTLENISQRKLSQSNNVVYAHITPDGNSIAYHTIEDNETRTLWIRRIADRNALQLLPPRPVQFWGGLTLTEDGSSIFYVTAERAARHGTLYRISSLGGQPRKLVDAVNDLGSLSPNGDRLLIVRYGEKTQLISVMAADGSDERVLRSSSPDTLYRDPQFSVDGKRVYSIRFDREAGVEFWSLVEMSADGGNETVLIPKQRPKMS